jgi:hypothetical protein
MRNKTSHSAGHVFNYTVTIVIGMSWLMSHFMTAVVGVSGGHGTDDYSGCSRDWRPPLLGAARHRQLQGSRAVLLLQPPWRNGPAFATFCSGARAGSRASPAPSCPRALSPLWQLMGRLARVQAVAYLPAEVQQSICHGGALVPYVPCVRRGGPERGWAGRSHFHRWYARRSALCHGHRACESVCWCPRHCSVLLAGAVAAG